MDFGSEQSARIAETVDLRMIIIKRREPQQTLNDLETYLMLNGGEPARLLAREVQSWGEFSYAEIEAAIEDGRLNELLDWQERYASVVNEYLSPLWLKALQAAAEKSSRGKIVLSDSDVDVNQWIRTHGAELISNLSTESKRAVANLLLKWQAELLNPRVMAQQIRPLIGLTSRQAMAVENYRRVAGDKAAMRYAAKQHRFRAETIVHTELAYAYNQGAHMGVQRSIAAGYMTRCEMIWSTAGTNRVCGRCLELKDKVVGYTDEQVQLPPLHPRCRCVIIYRETNENRRLITPELPYKPVTEERYQQLIIPLKKMGVTIMRGDADTERRLKMFGAQGITSGCDVVSFGKDVSISTILEETHHIRQNRRGLNDDKEISLRTILNEIDAKKYLLRVADKYGIPRGETEETKLQLKEYEAALKEYKERHDERHD